MGPNVEQIRAQATKVVRGRIPIEVRRELSAAVKSGELGRLPKKGLAPEIFFHPDHKNSAIELQKREAEYGISCIAKVLMQRVLVDVESAVGRVRVEQSGLRYTVAVDGIVRHPDCNAEDVMRALGHYLASAASNKN